MKVLQSFFSLILILSIVLSVTACGKGNTSTTTESTTIPPVYNDIIPNETTQSIPVETFSETIQSVTPETQTPVTQAPEVTQSNSPTPTTPQTQVPATQATTQPPVNQTPQSSPTTGIGKYTANYNGIEQAVFYPEKAVSGKTKYPIVAWANGTGVSYTFYEKLLEAIAAGGYIVVANTVSMAADGTAQISSIDFIISENSNANSILYKKINTNKIAVSGHSQGGRCAVNVAALDSRVSCVLSIAGSNYLEEAQKNNLPSLFLTGTSDWIVGSSQWVKPAYEACNSSAVYASYTGGTHTTCCSDIETYSYYSIKWFDAYLKNDASAKKIFQNGGELSQDSKWQDFMCKGM